MLTLLIKKNLLIENGLIHETPFMNYVYVCIQNNKTTEAKSFVKKYGEYVPNNLKNIIINLCYARIFIAEGKYSDSLAAIYKLKTTYWYYQLNFKYVTFICYYELGQVNELKSELDSIKHFLFNKKLPKNFQNSALIFLEVSSNLLILSKKYSINLFEKINNKLNSRTNIPYSSWFAEKIKILSNKKGQLNTAALKI